jgi:hypothetical protein
MARQQDDIRGTAVGPRGVRTGVRGSARVQLTCENVSENPRQSMRHQPSRPTFNRGVPSSIPGGPTNKIGYRTRDAGRASADLRQDPCSDR